MLENDELDYISTHTRKYILTSTNPAIHLLDLPRNVFRLNKALLLAGTKLKEHLQKLKAHHSHSFAHSWALKNATSKIPRTVQKNP